MSFVKFRRLTGTTRCTNEGEIWRGWVDLESKFNLDRPQRYKGRSVDPKTEDLRNFEINAPQRVSLSLGRFCEISRQLHVRLILKIWMEFKGFRSCGFKLRGCVFPRFTAPHHNGKTTRRMRMRFRETRMVRAPLGLINLSIA